MGGDPNLPSCHKRVQRRPREGEGTCPGSHSKSSYDAGDQQEVVAAQPARCDPGPAGVASLGVHLQK